MPALSLSCSTEHRDDGPGVAASYPLWHGSAAACGRMAGPVNTRAVEAPTTAAVVAATAALLLVWTALLRLEQQILDAVRRTRPRFPTPPDEA